MEEGAEWSAVFDGVGFAVFSECGGVVVVWDIRCVASLGAMFFSDLDSLGMSGRFDGCIFEIARGGGRDYGIQSKWWVKVEMKL